MKFYDVWFEAVVFEMGCERNEYATACTLLARFTNMRIKWSCYDQHQNNHKARLMLNQNSETHIHTHTHTNNQHLYTPVMNITNSE